MPQTPADAQAARNAAIVALAAGQLAALWPRVDWASPSAVAAVTTVYGAIVNKYGRAAAATAAQFYDQQRRKATLPTTYTARPAAPIPDVVIEKAVRSAFLGVTVTVDSPTTTSDLPLEQRVPARLDSSLQRHVLQSARDTIAENAAADPAKAIYIRVPRGTKTCAFCVMLASRAIDVGFGGYSAAGVKWDEELGRNIHVTTGRGRTPVASRSGKTPIGQRYHDHCDCEPVPLFGQAEADVSPNFGDYQDMYYKAAADAGTYSDTAKILASMRQIYGVK